MSHLGQLAQITQLSLGPTASNHLISSNRLKVQITELSYLAQLAQIEQMSHLAQVDQITTVSFGPTWSNDATGSNDTIVSF